MKIHTKLLRALLPLFSLSFFGLLVTPDGTYAQSRRQVVHPRHGPVYGQAVRTLPRDYVPVTVVGVPYFYYRGVF